MDVGSCLPLPPPKDKKATLQEMTQQWAAVVDLAQRDPKWIQKLLGVARLGIEV